MNIAHILGVVLKINQKKKKNSYPLKNIVPSRITKPMIVTVPFRSLIVYEGMALLWWKFSSYSKMNNIWPKIHNYCNILFSSASNERLLRV